jgi:YjbE family integral membrane protein
MSAVLVLSVLQITWIDILLSGDNAVVIAMACRSLPPRKRVVGITLGVIAAFILRVCFAAAIAYLLAVPYLKLVGGALLLWIAVKLVRGEDEDGGPTKEVTGLIRAVLTIAAADAVMSLDNVVAIAAASHGNDVLFVLGLLVSMPLMIFGASLISAAVSRWPIIVWAGGALLGWIAGEMVLSDRHVIEAVYMAVHDVRVLASYAAAAFCALLVVALGQIARGFRQAPSPAPEPAP